MEHLHMAKSFIEQQLSRLSTVSNSEEYSGYK